MIDMQMSSNEVVPLIIPFPFLELRWRLSSLLKREEEKYNGLFRKILSYSDSKGISSLFITHFDVTEVTRPGTDLHDILINAHIFKESIDDLQEGDLIVTSVEIDNSVGYTFSGTKCSYFPSRDNFF